MRTCLHEYTVILLPKMTIIICNKDFATQRYYVLAMLPWRTRAIRPIAQGVLSGVVEDAQVFYNIYGQKTF